MAIQAFAVARYILGLLSLQGQVDMLRLADEPVIFGHSIVCGLQCLASLHHLVIY